MSMVARSSLALIAVIVVLAAGCSDGSGPQGPDAVDLEKSCNDPSYSPPNRDELCGSGSESGLAKGKVGQSFEYTQTYSDGSAPVNWKITVTSLKCGITEIPKGASNPKWQGESDVPQLITATPPPGKEFCRVDASMTNVGRTPGNSMDFADIEIDKGQFASSQEDEQYSDNLKDALSTGSKTNPGDTIEVARVYTVPAGSRPVAVLFPWATAFSGPTHRIEV
jgi:hypothetical protein